MANPTPYDIFNTSKENLDSKAVRAHFYSLAKVYHPDASIKVKGLTPKLKSDRFKQLVAAYDILRDDKKRRDYDLTNKGWEYGSKVHKKNFYGRDFSKAARYTTHSKSQTAWDDFHQDYKDYQEQMDPQKQKESWENHKRMIVYVTVGCILIGAFQVKFLMHSAGKDIEARNRISRESQRRVYMATQNYGMGVAKDDRIQRFLAHREGTSSYDNYKELRLAQEAEKVALLGEGTKN